MKALFNPESVLDKTVILIVLVSLFNFIFPEAFILQKASASDQTSGQQALIFKIKDSSVLEPHNQTSITIEQITQEDPLVVALTEYLEKNNSPMAEEAAELIKFDKWQKGLAISFVESNFCRRAMNKNCSSIGVAPGHRLWRKYDNYSEWMADMSALMNKPLYSQKYNTFQKMKGVYVVPGSKAWVNGAQKKYDELIQLTETAEQQRAEMHRNLQVAMLPSQITSQ